LKKNAYFNWSSGKDSALALYIAQQSNEFNIQYLFTSINGVFNRVSMHGVRTELVEQQAKKIGIPLIKMELPEMPSMEDYEKIMLEKLLFFKEKGIQDTLFGDIFLEDLRKYREDKLQTLGITAHFPLWKKDTKEMILDFLQLGFKTIVVCVNEQFLDQSFVGRVIDEQFLADLPPNVDPCGENGEFHTFIFDGPIFNEPVTFEIGEIVHKTYPKPKRQTSILRIR
jgi:uncharacterized protein (TIGR00290 family)